MRHNTTLPLFADDMLPITPKASHPGLPAAWSARQRENFTWWCQNGNADMCAAVLWRGGVQHTRSAQLDTNQARR